jgi:hypothetical protein
MHIETSHFALFVTQTAHFTLAGNSREYRTSRLFGCILLFEVTQSSGCATSLGTKGHNRQWAAWNAARVEITGRGLDKPGVDGEVKVLCYSSSAETFVVFASNFHV